MPDSRRIWPFSRSSADLLRALASYVEGGAAEAVLEPILRIRVPAPDRVDLGLQSLLPDLAQIAAREPETEHIVLESAFAQYVEKWAVMPTLDATGHALHSLRSLERLSPWLARHRERVRGFLATCVTPEGVTVGPLDPSGPSLFAALSACSVLKALADRPQHEPLHRLEGEARAAIGDKLYDEFVSSTISLLRACVPDRLFVDSPARGSATVHSVDFGISLLWNLFPQVDICRYGVTAQAVTELLDACRVRHAESDGEGYSAVPAGAGPARSPCTSTTALVFRICRRSAEICRDWPLSINRSRALNFLRAMAHEGGAPVFPGELESLSATSYICDALVSEAQPGGKWADGIPLEKVRRFSRDCYRSGGGFAFSHSPVFFANATCTRFGLRVRDALRQLDERADFLDASMQRDIVEFLQGLFDPECGGFQGYPRPGSSAHRLQLEAQLAEGRSAPGEGRRMDADCSGSDLRWFHDNLQTARLFGTEYVAIQDGRFVGSGTAREALAQARAAGASDPLLVLVPREEPGEVSRAGL